MQGPILTTPEMLNLDVPFHQYPLKPIDPTLIPRSSNTVWFMKQLMKLKDSYYVYMVNIWPHYKCTEIVNLRLQVIIDNLPNEAIFDNFM